MSKKSILDQAYEKGFEDSKSNLKILEKENKQLLSIINYYNKHLLKELNELTNLNNKESE